MRNSSHPKSESCRLKLRLTSFLHQGGKFIDIEWTPIKPIDAQIATIMRIRIIGRELLQVRLECQHRVNPEEGMVPGNRKQ